MGYGKDNAANVFPSDDEEEKKVNVIGIPPAADMALPGLCSVRE